MYEIPDDPFEQWVQEHDLMYLWECPMCGYGYESRPGINEECTCPKCGAICRKAGESYK